MDLVALVRMSSKVSIEVVLVIVVILIFAGVFVAMALSPPISRDGFVSCPTGQCADSRGKCSVLNC